MKIESDSYAQGMSEFKEDDYDSITKLTDFEYSLFEGHLGRKILEIGAGWGRLTEHTLRQHDLDELVAIEPSPDLFAKLKRRMLANPKLTLLSSEVSALKSRYKGHFDSCFSVHVLEHVEDDKKFIEDSLTLLRPHGKLIILVPALQFLYSDLDRNIGHFRRYDKKMAHDLIHGLDGRIVGLFYNNFFGVLASLYFLKFKNLEYQSTEKKGKFVFLFKVYDKYFIPVVAFIEKWLPVPLGLNLTIVIEKN